MNDPGATSFRKFTRIAWSRLQSSLSLWDLPAAAPFICTHILFHCCGFFFHPQRKNQLDLRAFSYAENESKLFWH